MIYSPVEQIGIIESSSLLRLQREHRPIVTNNAKETGYKIPITDGIKDTVLQKLRF
jgi:hypothetical protein